MSYQWEARPFLGILWRVRRAGYLWVVGGKSSSGCFLINSSRDEAGWFSVLLLLSLLVCTAPEVGIGYKSAEEILLMTVSHWSSLNPETNICSDIRWGEEWGFYTNKNGWFFPLSINQGICLAELTLGICWVLFSIWNLCMYNYIFSFGEHGSHCTCTQTVFW